MNKTFFMQLQEAEQILSAILPTDNVDTPDDITTTYLEDIANKHSIKEYKTIGKYTITIYGYFTTFNKMNEFIGNILPDSYKDMIGNDHLVYFTAEGPSNFGLVYNTQTSKLYQFDLNADMEVEGKPYQKLKALGVAHRQFMMKWVDAICAEYELK